MNHEKISLDLFSTIPESEISRVMNQKYCDIEPQFMGFVSTYKMLSEIIPPHFTVIDLGCAYNPQCYYFTKHKKYIAVDSFPNHERFKTDNCDLYNIDIMDFIDSELLSLNIDLKTTFAICNYVPEWGKLDKKRVRETFDNIFMFYPKGGFDVSL